MWSESRENSYQLAVWHTISKERPIWTFLLAKTTTKYEHKLPQENLQISLQYQIMVKLANKHFFIINSKATSCGQNIAEE